MTFSLSVIGTVIHVNFHNLVNYFVTLFYRVIRGDNLTWEIMFMS